MILVTGASGNAGGAVLKAVLTRGLPAKGMYRSAQEAGNVPAGAASVIADFADTASLRRALEGIETAFVVCGPIPQLIEFEANMIQACRAAGVRHVVLNSALGAGHYGKSFPSWHLQVEDKLKASGLAWTIIRPNGFMQNIVTYNAASIRAQHAFYAAMGDAKISLIDVRDVGDTVAGILTDLPLHAGATYELNGPQALSNADVARRITGAIGTEVSFVDIPEAAQRQAMLDSGMPAWQVDAVLELQEYYRTGACASVDGVVARLAGKPPRSLDAYLAENADSFRSPTA